MCFVIQYYVICQFASENQSKIFPYVLSHDKHLWLCKDVYTYSNPILCIGIIYSAWQLKVNGFDEQCEGPRI